MPLAIEPLKPHDLDEVLLIERASFPNPWSRRAFLHELRENPVARLWVARAEAGGGVLGYLCLWFVVDEVHITNVAVHPSHRRHGVGRALMAAILSRYRAEGATRAVLEVRPSNKEARQLYEAFGFRSVGRRKGYYFDNGEDALVMEMTLSAWPSGNQAEGLGVESL